MLALQHGIQGAGTARLRLFTRGHTVDPKNNEAEDESRYNQVPMAKALSVLCSHPS